jgi:4-carboxymuconolactone decarboxylase
LCSLPAAADHHIRLIVRCGERLDRFKWHRRPIRTSHRSPKDDDMTVQLAEETFRRLAIGDQSLLARIADPSAATDGERSLDDLTAALLRIGALVAIDAPESSYRSVVDAAVRAGARLDDLVAVLCAVAGPVGSARIVSAAPRLAMAAGYDVEADLERR